MGFTNTNSPEPNTPSSPATGEAISQLVRLLARQCAREVFAADPTPEVNKDTPHE